MQTANRSSLASVPCVAVPRKPFCAVLSGAAAMIVAGSSIAAPALAGSVNFSNVSDGATVASPVAVEFSVDGMDVLPAAQGIVEGTGHFHVLVDADEEYPFGTPIPFDIHHLHYGKAQTSANLELPAGKHKLALQFANALHESYGPEYKKTINVTVQ